MPLNLRVLEELDLDFLSSGQGVWLRAGKARRSRSLRVHVCLIIVIDIFIIISSRSIIIIYSLAGRF